MSSPKRLFEVQVWDYNMKRKLRSFWTQVVEKKDESDMRRAAWNKARYQAYQIGLGEYFEMDSFQIKVVDAKQRAVGRQQKTIDKEFQGYGTCPECGNETIEEGDFCNHCGWRKQSSTWYERLTAAG